MRVHDVVADLELDVLDGRDDRKFLFQVLILIEVLILVQVLFQ
jgi:hypothetical protein